MLSQTRLGKTLFNSYMISKKCVVNCLPAKVSLGNWILCMTHKRNPGDELALFLLCKLFNQHAVIITKSGLWTTLETNSNEGELAIHAKCDICLILVGQGNTGFGEVVRVIPTKSLTKRNKQQKPVGISVQQAVSQEDRKGNRRSNRIWRNLTVSSTNILPDTGRSHNTRTSNSTHTQHTNRQLRRTYRDINYKDMDVKS